MKQFFGKKKLAKLVTLSVMTGAMLGVASGAWAEDYYTANGQTISDSVEYSGTSQYAVTATNGKSITFNGETIKFDVTHNEKQLFVINSRLSGSDKNRPIINLGGEGTKLVSIKGSSSYENVNTGIYAGNDYNDRLSGGGLVTVAGEKLEIEINSEGSWSAGVYAQNRTTKTDGNVSEDIVATVNLNSGETIITATTPGYGSSGIIAMSQGKVVANTNLTVTADDALSARGDSILHINTDGRHFTKLYGNIDFDFDGYSSGSAVNADVQVNLTGSESEWVGNVVNNYGRMTAAQHDNKENLLKVTTLQLTLANGGTWKPTYVNEYEEDDDTSYSGYPYYGTKQLPVNVLTMNAGIIDMTTEKTADNTKAMVGTLAGESGVVKMDADNVFEVATISNKDLVVKGGKVVIDTVDTAGKVTLNGVTVTGDTKRITNFGTMNIEDGSKFTNNTNTEGWGGVIFNKAGATLNVDGAEFSDNKASSGGAISSAVPSGSTINIMAIKNTIFKNNEATCQGGALGNFSNMTIFDSEFTENKTTDKLDDGGGAIFLGSSSETSITGSTSIKNVTFTNNESASYGGAIATRLSAADTVATSSGVGNNTNAKLNISNATFTGNKAATNGGAFDNNFWHSAGEGDEANSVQIINSVFESNTAGIIDSPVTSRGKGGAIYNHSDGASKEGAITVAGGSFIENIAYYSGGAIFSEGKLTVIGTEDQHVLFSKNEAKTGWGGAIVNAKNGTATIQYVDFVENKASASGAVSNYLPASRLLKISDSKFDKNEAECQGGALGNFSTMTIDSTTFSNNKITLNNDDGGGAVFLGAESVSTISSVTFNSNESTTYGGAIATRYTGTSGSTNKAAKLDIVDSTFENNKAATDGGAIDNYFMHSTKLQNNGNDAVYVSDSTFIGNSAKNGGAIYNHKTDSSNNFVAMYIANSTFTNNTATANGGAIYNEGTLVLDNVTFSGNKANGVANDIYNAGTLTLNNVKLDGGVENATTGTIEVGKGTRVLVEKVGDENANLTVTSGTSVLTMAGGTLVTSKIDAAVAGAEKFTMTSGVVEYGADYYLADAIKWAGVVQGLNSNKDAFSLKLTGNLLQDPGKQAETVKLETLQESKLELPTADVDAKDLVDETKKELVIGGESTSVKNDVVVGTLDVGKAEKIVVAPATGQEEIVLEFGNSNASGPLIVTESGDKVNVELMEGAKIAVVENQKLEIKNLDAKDNAAKHVTLVGDIVAEKFNVGTPSDDPTQTIICFNIGNEERGGSLAIEQEVNLQGAMVFVDPAWANGIEQGSAYSQAGTVVNGKLVAGRNSVISVGTADRTEAEKIFKETGMSYGNNGDVNAVLYVAKPQTMGEYGAIYLDGSLTDKPADTAVNNKTFTANAKSLTMVEAAAAGADGAISGLTSATVDSAAKLYVANANANEEYTILKGAGIGGWTGDNISVNGLIEGITIVGSDNTCFIVKTGGLTFNVDNTVMPNVGDAIVAGSDVKAKEALKAMVDTPSEAQQAANVNAYANLGENLGVTRGAYDVANMVGNAVTEHWDNNAKGENIWAVYTHSKDKVDGLKLGGMDAKYDTQYNGVVVGADLNKDFGIALNYADGNVTNGYGGHNDAKYYGVSVYGRKNFGKVNLLGDVTYSHGKNELAQNGIEADAKTNTFSMGVTAKYATNIVKVGNVTPFVGVRYVRIDGKDYRDSIGVNREADKVNSVIVPMGVEYSGEFKMAKSAWTFKPVVAVGYVFNLGDKDNTMTLGYNGAKDSFGYDFADNGAFFTKAALNFTKKNLTLGVGYDYMKSKNSKNNRWNVSLNFAF